MAGTLVVDELKSATTVPPVVKNTNGAEVGQFCRMRVHADSTTSPASIKDAFNVSSLTDMAVGDVIVNYAVQSGRGPNDTACFGVVPLASNNSTIFAPVPPSVSGLRIGYLYPGVNYYDNAYMMAAVFGD